MKRYTRIQSSTYYDTSDSVFENSSYDSNHSFDFSNRYRGVYEGPVYRFNSYIGDVSITTTACSEDKVRANLIYNAKCALNLKPSVKITISDSNMIIYDRLPDYLNSLTCPDCGNRLSDDGTCPYCDYGEEDLVCDK